MEITSKSYLSPLSTPKTDGTFNVYDDVRNKLVERGIPKEQIAFIHEYNTEVKKAELFAKVRALRRAASRRGSRSRVTEGFKDYSL